MSSFEFSAAATADIIRRRSYRKSGLRGLWFGVAGAALVYSTGNPGRITITTGLNNNTTNERFIQVQGVVENPAVHAILLDVNGASQPVSATAGRFVALVPLTHGENVIHASVAGAIANLIPGSGLIHVNARIAPADIWSALTWDGAGDIDLHLVLPDGEECYYRHPSASGATLDFDNKVSDGPEHIVMEKATPGKYQVRVVYYAQPGPARGVHWSVDLRLKDGRERSNFSGVLEKPGEVQNVTAFSFP